MDAPAVERALILAVESDPHLKRLERYFLEEAGFQVEFADNGREGLERARALRPRIVVTEVLLPQLDGLEVCRALKSDPATKDIVVLVFSILRVEERARQAGADGFLRKPLDDALLIDTVKTLLAKKSGEKSGGRP
jgi:CheY-like chemotaxis protein